MAVLPIRTFRVSHSISVNDNFKILSKMLARIVLPRAFKLKTLCPVLVTCVRKAETCANTEEGPERDLINFPRPVRAEFPPPVRYMFIPESFFQFFYKKTGVSGPYVWGIGLILYLHSKEIWVIEHDYGYVYATILIIYSVNYLYGKQLKDFFSNNVDEELAQLNKGREDSIQFCSDSVAAEKKEQWRAEGLKLVYDAKKENVSLQLEAIYRENHMMAYSEVKKRLDYQVECNNVTRRFQQVHMVQWIVDNVLKSLTAEQEKESLKQCFADLKALAAHGTS